MSRSRIPIYLLLAALLLVACDRSSISSSPSVVGSSPDSSQVAAANDLLFGVSKPDQTLALYAANIATQSVQPFSPADTDDREAAWAPDGTRIAVVRIADKAQSRSTVMMMNADGSA